MKLTIKAVNFEMAEKLEKYIDKKTKRYEKLLGEKGEMEVRMNVVKRETAMNKETKVRVLGVGQELFASEVCDTFEQGLDQSLDAINRQLERLKEKK